MKIYQYMGMADFPAWAGGKDTLETIINAGKAAELENLLIETEPADGWSDVAVNDVLWFESDWLFEMLGINQDEDEEEDEEN